MSIAFWETKKRQDKEFINPFQTNNSDSRQDNRSPQQNNKCPIIPKIEIVVNDGNNCCGSVKPMPNPIPDSYHCHVVSDPKNPKFNKYERCADLKCKLAHTEEKIKEMEAKKEMLTREISDIDKLLKSLRDKKSDIVTKLETLKCI